MKVDLFNFLIGLLSLLFGFLYLFFPEKIALSDNNDAIGYPELMNDMFRHFGGWLPGMISLFTGIFLLKISVQKKCSYIEIHGIKYSKDAYAFVKKNNISFKDIENAISLGKKSKSKEYKYSWYNDNGLKILVFVSLEGVVLKVVI